MSDRHEARLVLAAARDDWSAFDALLGRRGADPERFLDTARRCDVAPWVHDRLERARRLETLPAPLAQGLEAARDRCRRDNLVLLAIAERTLDLLGAAGIRPVALKGLDVVHRFYPSFDCRATDDLDLLVRPEQVRPAVEALEAAGYTGPTGEAREHWFRSSFELPMTSPGTVGVSVELHWSLGQERRYAIALDDLLDRVVPLDVAGRAVSRLSTLDAAAHLLLHHVQHYFDRRLKWVLELGWMTREPDFSWDGLAERLERWGGTVAAGAALRHVRELIPEAIPRTALDRLPFPAWRRLLVAPLRSSHPLDHYRGTRRRLVQLWLATACLERASDLPGYLRHRATRDGTAASSAVERVDRPGHSAPPNRE